MRLTLAEWFAVLPGNISAAQRTAVISRCKAADPGTRVLAVQDGQPWIVGRSLRPLVIARSGVTTVALIGTHGLDEARLVGQVKGLWACGVEPLMRHPGSYHAIARFGDEVWVCGDTAGMRPVFTAEIAGHLVLGDHARILAETAGPVRLDPAHLAAHLLAPAPLLALADSGATCYEGVRAVPPGWAAHITAGGALSVRSWWSVPDDEVDLPDAAAGFRDALAQAVAVRTGNEDGIVACELSGGADSTAISALAYRQAPGRLLNMTRIPADPGNDDLDWARTAAAEQAGVRHHIFGPDDIPEQFAGLGAPFRLDAPSPAAVSPDRQTAWWRHATAAGASVLLSGKGGDEVMLAAWPYLHHARRRDARTARRHVAGWAALWGVSRRQVKQLAADPGPYRAWLATLCERRLDPPAAGWEAGPRVPPWLTRQAREAMTAALGDVARAARPLHERVHQHTTMAALRSLARWARLQADAAGNFGIDLGYPYTDRAVIEAALRCRAEQRISPYQLKPLLTQAMEGIVPAINLTRRTKGGYSADTAGARIRHRPGLAALLGSGGVLADLGLVDVGPLTAAAQGWDRADTRTDLMLHLTVMCEIFARTASNHSMPSGVGVSEARC
ncbi:asparagine synthase-related protein [Streptomyces sp. B1866]|uniref:asparagine synthase-related protein n=1 Tax=Streptomyces sp. B1866 TaxID=3075431 RepID=UPI002890F1E1|nr:asparagine synthase-related protein [Streptomyces sp. B1866]MDT3397422.1 asparagine synthase-related protein [Streptomyces sp. B1866]